LPRAGLDAFNLRAIPTAPTQRHPAELEPPSPPRATIIFMAVAVGAIVANIYYVQPLLADIARAFHITATGAGAVAMLMQLGTTGAMLGFVPLGDVRERRSLITTLVAVLAVALAGVALAPSLFWLCVAGVFVGASGSAVHLIIPFAAHLSPDKSRGRVLGIVVGGLLMGILLARTLSGYVGAAWGWRTMYWIAAGLMAVMTILLRVLLPRSEPTVQLRYPALLRSIWQLFRAEPLLRESAFLGAMFFLAFSAFWTTLAFRLETAPFHYGSAVAGSFGLVGAAGAAAAPLVGRLADRHGPRATVGWALLLGFISFGVLGWGGSTLAGLIAGVVLLDLGVQAGHIANQTRIYSLVPSARGRLNAVYMTCYFMGGSCGSILGVWGWQLAGWWGVCLCGFGAMGLGLTVHFRSARKPILELPGK
jgi:predicted MFS family arabinose efflux permease